MGRRKNTVRALAGKPWDEHQTKLWAFVNRSTWTDVIEATWLFSVLHGGWLGNLKEVYYNTVNCGMSSNAAMSALAGENASLHAGKMAYQTRKY